MSASGARRTFARKKLEWVTCFNSICEAGELSFLPCEDGALPLDSGGAIPLLTSNSSFNAGYDYGANQGDAIIVRRLSGRVAFFLTSDQGTGSTGYWTVRMGLKVVETPGRDPVLPQYNPLEGNPGTAGTTTQDYADARWLKLWEKYIQPRAWILNQTWTPQLWKPTLNMCVAGTDACVFPESLTDGSGYTWNINGQHPLGLHMSGQCVTCEPDDPQITLGAAGIPVANWQFSLNMKRSIRLRENQSLVLYVNGVNLPNTVPETGTVGVYGGVRALIEK